MRIRSRLVAAVAVAALSLGGVLASATTASAALPDGTLTIHSPLLTDAQYEGDVVFSGSGWTPEHPVIVELRTSSPFGEYAISSHTVTADINGDIAGSWTPDAFLLGNDFTFAAREEATDANDNQTRGSNAVPLIRYPSPGVILNLDYSALNFTEGDTAWGGGIAFTSTGWTPGATVRFGTTRWGDLNTAETDESAWVADEDGAVNGVWKATQLTPEVPTGAGYPSFSFQGVEVDSEDMPVKASHRADLTVVRSGTAPLIEVVDPVYPAGSFTRGIQVIGSGFTPGADVTVYFRFAFAPDSSGGQFGETTQADVNGEISYLLEPGPGWPGAFLPENGYPRYYAQAGEHGGDGSQIVALSNEALLTIEDDGTPQPPQLRVFGNEYAPGDPTWRGGIPFGGDGFTPGSTVRVSLRATTSADAGDQWDEDYVADAFGNISGVLHPSDAFTPQLTGGPGDYPSYTVLANELDGSEIVREANPSALFVFDAPRTTPVLTVDVTSFEDGDATWAGGIPFTGSGFVPGEEVSVYLGRIAYVTGDQRELVVVADDEGGIAGTFAPEDLTPEARDSSGYPYYYMYALQVGSQFRKSNWTTLTVNAAPEPPTPVIEVPASIPAEELANGVDIPFRDFAPGENVVFTISAMIDGEEEVLATPEGAADDDGAGILHLRITGLSSDLEVTIVGVGDDSGARATATFLADVADAPNDPTDPTDPGDGGSGAPIEVEGSLAQTGADQNAVTTIAGLGAGALVLGLVALVVLNRRRIGEFVTRR